MDCCLRVCFMDSIVLIDDIYLLWQPPSSCQYVVVDLFAWCLIDDTMPNVHDRGREMFLEHVFVQVFG